VRRVDGINQLIRFSLRDHFSVIDDGIGFDATRTSAGTGLQNMKDRVASLGGLLSLESKPGNGTTISGRLPTPARVPS
jgi:signal transduction histidine kinase